MTTLDRIKLRIVFILGISFFLSCQRTREPLQTFTNTNPSPGNDHNHTGDHHTPNFYPSLRRLVPISNTFTDTDDASWEIDLYPGAIQPIGVSARVMRSTSGSLMNPVTVYGPKYNYTVKHSVGANQTEQVSVTYTDQETGIQIIRSLTSSQFTVTAGQGELTCTATFDPTKLVSGSLNVMVDQFGMPETPLPVISAKITAKNALGASVSTDLVNYSTFFFALPQLPIPSQASQTTHTIPFLIFEQKPFWTDTVSDIFSFEVEDSTGAIASCTAPLSLKFIYSTPPLPQMTLSLSADQTFVNFNTSTTLRWTSTNATSCSIRNTRTGQVLSTNASGSISTGNLSTGTNFQLSCTQSSTTLYRDTFVDVDQSTIPPATVDIRANGQTNVVNVNQGANVTITWTFTNALSSNACTLIRHDSGFIFGRSPNGSYQTGALNGIGYLVFEASCANAISGGASANGTVTVVVQQAPPPSVNLLANGQSFFANVSYGSQATLSWSSQNASSCTIRNLNTGAIVASGANNSYTTPSLSQSGSIVYEASCTGIANGLTAYSQVTLYVGNPPFQNPTADLKINNSDTSIVVPFGSQVNVTWNSTFTSYCEVTRDGVVIDFSTSGSITTFALTSIQTYVFRVQCLGLNGAYITDSVSVSLSTPLFTALHDLSLSQEGAHINNVPSMPALYSLVGTFADCGSGLGVPGCSGHQYLFSKSLTISSASDSTLVITGLYITPENTHHVGLDPNVPFGFSHFGGVADCGLSNCGGNQTFAFRRESWNNILPGTLVYTNIRISPAEGSHIVGGGGCPADAPSMIGHVADCGLNSAGSANTCFGNQLVCVKLEPKPY